MQDCVLISQAQTRNDSSLKATLQSLMVNVWIVFD